MRTLTLDQVLTCANLPSLPSVAVEVLRLIGDHNIKLEKIAEVVQNDQALTAKILKTVNSSYYALPAPCPTITRAVAYMGLSAVKSLVLTFSLVEVGRQSGEGFDLVDYWRRCILAAAATRRIAIEHNLCDAEEAFTAALMQDVGMAAIHATIGERYSEVVAHAEGDHECLCGIELRELGFTHAEAGARLGERWRLPPAMVAAIRFHHDPADATEHLTIVRIVALGRLAAAALLSPAPDAIIAEFNRCASAWFEFDSTVLVKLLDTLAGEARALSRLLQVDTGDQPDIKAIQARAEEISLFHQIHTQREADELRRSNSDLARLAFTDALTGLGNRKKFDSELEQFFAAARNAGGRVAVIMLDADKFKSINDSHGHLAGDAVLTELARRMSAVVSPPAAVCRYGGEEFAIIAPGADRRAAAKIAEAVRLAVASAPVEACDDGGPKQIPATVSLGVAVFEPVTFERMLTPQYLVQAADRALYAAKNAGRNCVRVFTPKPTQARA